VLTSEVEGPITGDTVQIRPGATTTATIANDPFAQGQAGLSFSSPGEGMTGYADITLDLGASGEDWLRFDRDGDGVPDDDPAGRAVFGVFGGNDRLIYTREPWN
jgi:MSHA biogenesis protein MshQ